MTTQNTPIETGGKMPYAESLEARLTQQLALSEQDVGASLQYLSRAATGAFFLGTDRLPVEPDSEWAVDPESFLRGYQAWGLPADPPVGQVVDVPGCTPVTRDQLQPVFYRDPTGAEVEALWKPLQGFRALCVKGMHKGIVAEYTSAAISCCRTILRLVGAVKNRAAARQSVTPVILLQSKEFSTKWGRATMFNPTILRWLSFEDLATECDTPDPAYT